MAVAEHSETIELEEEDDINCENVETKTTAQEKYLLKILRPVIRLYRWVGVSFGLLCVVQVILNIVLRLTLYQCNSDCNITQLPAQFQSSCYDLITERDHFKASLDQSQSSSYDLITERDHFKASLDQLQSSYNNLTKERDDLKKMLDGWKRFGGSCYYISTGKENWENSRKYCRDRQSDLIVINNKEKQNFVASFYQTVWLGLTDSEVEGLFKWVNGTPLTTPTYWAPGQPDNRRDASTPPPHTQECVLFDNEGRPRGWIDAYCSNTHHWICEKVTC